MHEGSLKMDWMPQNTQSIHLIEKKIGLGSPGPSQWILDDFYYDVFKSKTIRKLSLRFFPSLISLIFPDPEKSLAE